MKVLFFGTVCNIDEYEKAMANCLDRPSIASIVWETSLLTGFKHNHIEVDILSFPMIPIWPKMKWLYWGNKEENLSCGYKTTWLRTINLPIFKQFSRKWNGHRLLKKWLIENKDNDCIVLTFSIPPFLAKDMIKLCKKYNVKCVAIVTDLLRDMYINEKNNSFVQKLKNYYLSDAIKVQGEFDGYVYLTEQMKDEINPNKPYIVMEGIADTDAVQNLEETDRSVPSAIMYAGRVEEKFGILNLVEAFEQADLGDAELWIFGNGNAEAQIQKCADKNSKIKFWGVKSREEVLLYERKASLLVNPRNVDDLYTQYSFPSKTIEYMLSGTPVLTTKLKGIPSEYNEYLFMCSDNKADTMAKSLCEIFSIDSEQRKDFGSRAKTFILQNKNAKKQTERMVEFFKELL